MIQDLQKRPFARPLLMWIAGVVWQTCFPVSPFLLGFWLLPAAVLLFASAVLAGRKAHFSFGARWLWGAAVLPIFMFLAMQKTACSQLGMTHTIVPETLLQLAEATQQHLLTPIDKLHLTGEEKSVFATLTLGARERMDRDVTARFSVTGAVHILSVSGFHVAIVCSFLTLLLSFLPRGGWGDWTRYGLSVGLLWVFVFVTGLEAASIRSALMLTLYLTGRRLNRNTDSYNIWAASAFCMLAYESFYLFDIDFQLSYLAVWSILYFQPRMRGWLPTRNPFFKIIGDGITVTLAAQAGTTFLCLYYFGQFSTVFLLTNLPLTFLSSILIPAGLLWLLLPESLPGYAVLQFAVEELTRALFGVVDAFSKVPGASLNVAFNEFSLFASYSLLFFAILFFHTGRKMWLFLFLFTLLVSITCFSFL